MHSLEFFSRRGFFFRPGFLDRETCRRVLKETRTADSTPARVFDGGPGPRLNLEARKACNIAVSGIDEIGNSLGRLRSELTAHFGIPLHGHEGPTLLRYQPGGFYEPHADRAGDDEAIAASGRRVSVVIFLNAMSPDPRPGDYAGGALTFYGVIDAPEWHAFGFALEPLPGLLVAFPSHLVHEVKPVTAGDRYTIVDWFTA